jgi:hypothetical protein
LVAHSDAGHSVDSIYRPSIGEITHKYVFQAEMHTPSELRIDPSGVADTSTRSQ